ncbi:MAG: class I SAM-dependent methyltransferase [Planctomycetes bacterium]|nr:class I SAM-dependent methyltransferase [Planctomycetota bacterium]
MRPDRNPNQRLCGASTVSWQLFDQESATYESWYSTAEGQRASHAETRLLAWLLATCPGTRTILEVGCGTGHFLGTFAARGLRPLGLDRSPGMLAQVRKRLPACPVVLGDAHELPLGDRAVDVVCFVTTLEFLADPRLALREAVRVAASAVLVVVLNRISAGALWRRLHPASRGTLIRHAHDLSPLQARALLAEAAGPRLAAVRIRTALLPAPLPSGPTRLPFGDVVGGALLLRPTTGAGSAGAPCGSSPRS